MANAKTLIKNTEDTLAVDLDSVLQQIRDADNNQVESQLTIARILAAVKEYKLYKPKYETFAQMVHMELDFAVHAAERYVSFHKLYKQFNYGREEMLKLMRQLGWRKIQFCLRTNKKKMGYRAMKTYLEKSYYCRDRQFNFDMKTPQMASKLERALKPFGLTHTKEGRRGNMTEAMEAMLDDYFALKRQANSKPNHKQKKTAA